MIERVAAYLQDSLVSPAEKGNGEKSQFYSELARIIAEILVISDEVEERQINPWLDMWRSDFVYSASELRELSALSVAQEEQMVGPLKELADSLDEVANMRLYLGSGDDLIEKVESVGALAQEMSDKHFADVPLAEGALNQVKELIRTSVLKLKDLYARSATMADSGRVEELQSQASELARPLTRFSRYNIDGLGDGIKSDLQQVARSLHLTETMRFYMDGGKSVKAILDRIATCAYQLAKLSEKISKAN